MNQNLYGMSTILCRDNIDLNKRIKKKLDKELGLIDLSKKLVIGSPVKTDERKIAFDKAFAELSSSIEMDIEVPTAAPVQKVPTEAPAQKVPTEAPAQKVPTEAPVQKVPAAAPVPSPQKAPAPTPKVITPAVIPVVSSAFGTSLPSISSLFDDSDDESLEDSMEDLSGSNSLEELSGDDSSEDPSSEEEEDEDEDEDEEPLSEEEENEDEDVPVPAEDSDDDDELENDFYNLDHITPKNFYSDLGASAEVSAKTNYLTKVGDIRRLSKELSISNYDTYLDKYGSEFQKGKKTIRPWDHKKYLDIVECIERLLVNEKESRNMDNIMRSVICTGLEVVEKLTKGSVKIPLLDKTFHTTGLSTIYKDVSTWNKMDHRDMTNKVTGGYRPSGAVSLGIKFVLETLSRQPISEGD